MSSADLDSGEQKPPSKSGSPAPKARCSYCQDTDRKRTKCDYCNREFCNACIWEHPCACASGQEACLANKKKNGDPFGVGSGRSYCKTCLSLFCEACAVKHAKSGCKAACAGCKKTPQYRCDCREYLCDACAPKHACRLRCRCGEPAQYRCACAMYHCKECLKKHAVLLKSVDRVRDELSKNNNAENLKSTYIEIPCQRAQPEAGVVRCRLTAKLATWNAQHLAVSTGDEETKKKREEKKKKKLATIGHLMGEGGVDAIALQEVNMTGAKVLAKLLDEHPETPFQLYLGPLLASQAWESRLQFAKRFTLSGSTTEGLREQVRAFDIDSKGKKLQPEAAREDEKKKLENHKSYLLEQINLNKRNQVDDWKKRVIVHDVEKKKRAEDKAKRRKEGEKIPRDKESEVERYQKLVDGLKKELPIAEAYYLLFRELHDSYKEYYPLLIRVESRITLVSTQVFYGSGKYHATNSNLHSLGGGGDPDPLYFRGPSEDTGVDGAEGEVDPDRADEVEDEENGPVDDADEKAPQFRYRPVVVYNLKKTCKAPKDSAELEECLDCPFHLGVVHTSPAGKEFNRVKIFQDQLRKVFECPGVDLQEFWVFAGDYYTTPETVTTPEDDRPKGRKRFVNENRNVWRFTFEKNLPTGLEVVAAASGTNPGKWKPKKSPDPLNEKSLDSSSVQTADLTVCSSNWTIKRAFTVDTRTGEPHVTDEDHEALQQMMRDETSDHLPVIIYVSKHASTDELEELLGYTDEIKAKAEKTSGSHAKSKNEAGEPSEKILNRINLLRFLKRDNEKDIDFYQNEASSPEFDDEQSDEYESHCLELLVKTANEHKRTCSSIVNILVPRVLDGSPLDYSPDLLQCIPETVDNPLVARTNPHDDPIDRRRDANRSGPEASRGPEDEEMQEGGEESGEAYAIEVQLSDEKCASEPVEKKQKRNGPDFTNKNT